MKDHKNYKNLFSNILKQSLCFLIVLLVSAFCFNKSYAIKSDSVTVTLSPRVIGDTSTNPAIDVVLDLWRSYLNSRPDSVYDNPYWSLEERRKLKDFDLTSLIYREVGKHFFKIWKPCVLSVDSISDGYLIQTAYIECDTAFLDQSLWACQNVLAKRENGSWKLFNALPYECAKLCNEKRIGRFKFIYSKDHRFNEALARKTIAFVNSLSKTFSIPLRDSLEYYLADNLSDLSTMMGMPYCLPMPDGLTLSEDGRIFTSSGLEFYPHELTHLVFGTCGSRFASEGIATWQGGGNYREGTLENSIQNTLDDIHLGSALTLDSVITHVYQFRSSALFYATGGMVAALVYNAKGPQGIRELRDAKQNELVATIDKLIGDSHLTVGMIWHRYALLKPDRNEAK